MEFPTIRLPVVNITRRHCYSNSFARIRNYIAQTVVYIIRERVTADEVWGMFGLSTKMPRTKRVARLTIILVSGKCKTKFRFRLNSLSLTFPE